MAKKPNYVVPKDSLKRLNKFEQLAKAKALESAQHGQSPMQKELTALEFELVRDDTRAVQAYVSQMVTVIREHEGSLSELLLAVPLIEEVAKVAFMNDFTLAPKEKSRIADASNKLQAFIRKYTTLKSRVAQTLQSKVANLARSRRESMSDTLSGSASALFRLAGRALAPKRQNSSDYEKSVKEARANVYQNTVERRRARMASANRGRGGDWDDYDDLFDWDEDDYSGSSKKRGKGRGRKKSKKVSTEDWSSFGDDFGVPAGRPSASPGAGGPVFQSMLTELQAIRALLRTQVEGEIREDEAAYRDADNIPKPGAPVQVKTSKPKSGSSLFNGVRGALSQFTDLFTGSNGLISVARALGPALKGLGIAAGVAGSFMIGWEIGEQLDKWFDLRNKVSKAALFWENHIRRLMGLDPHKTDEQHAFEMEEERRRARGEETITDKTSRVATEVQNTTTFNPENMPGTIHQNPALAFAMKPPTPAKKPTPKFAFPTPYDDDGDGNADVPKPPTPKRFESSGVTSQALSTPASTPASTPVSTAPARPKTGSTPARRVPKTAFNFDYEVYKETVGARESKGRGGYRAENRYGYLGKYQMGVMALITAGLLKAGTKQSKSAVANDNNWTIPGGKEAFLGNPSLQDRVMYEYTQRNLKRLKQIKLVTDDDAPEDVAGKLMASHLIGPDGLKKKGMQGKDANQTTAAEYYQLGSAAQLAASTPSPTRTAAPVAAAAAASTGQSVTVVAPNTVVQSNAPAPATVVPMPMRTENAEVTLRALRAANSI